MRKPAPSSSNVSGGCSMEGKSNSQYSVGFCQCGCGAQTREVSGVPRRFVHNHHKRTPRCVIEARLDGGGKRCQQCKQVLPMIDFGNRRRSRDGRTSICVFCQRANHSAQYRKLRANPVQFASAMQKQKAGKFGLSIDAYYQLVMASGGICAICHRPENTTDGNGKLRSLALDHDRKCCPGNRACGKCLRGMICRKCNVAIGLLDDSPSRMVMAILYLSGEENVGCQWTQAFLDHQKRKCPCYPGASHV